MGLFDSFIGQDYSYPSVGVDSPNWLSGTAMDYSPDLSAIYSTPGGSVWGDNAGWSSGFGGNQIAANQIDNYSMGPNLGGGAPSLVDASYSSMPASGDQGSMFGGLGSLLMSSFQNDPAKWLTAGGKVFEGLLNANQIKKQNKIAKQYQQQFAQDAAYKKQMQDYALKSAAVNNALNNSYDIPGAITNKWVAPTGDVNTMFMGTDPSARLGSFTQDIAPSQRVQLAEGGAVGHPEAMLPDLDYIGYLLNMGKGIHREDYQNDESAKDRLAGFGKEGLVGVATRKHSDAMDKAMKDSFACGGLNSMLSKGGTSGQADVIPAQLSDGEYVMDADTVSALGDGNTAAGASALDQMRQNIRKHKRSAPVNKIPPKAKSPESYIPKKARK